MDSFANEHPPQPDNGPSASAQGPTHSTPPHTPPVFLQAAPPPAKRKYGCLTWVLLASTIGLASVCFLLFVMVTMLVGQTTGAWKGGASATGARFSEETVCGKPGSQQKVLLISVQGIIMDVPERGLVQSHPGLVSTVRSQLDAAREDDAIKAVIIEVNSPGGGITASDILHHEIASFRVETGKPVVALLGDVAASGGYYVAAAAEHIIARPTTVTGSIGVIMPLWSVEELADKLGVESRPIKSGRHKDMGSMFRPMAEKERQMLQALVDQYHKVFVSVVQKGFTIRGKTIADEKLRELCDGRIFTGHKAVTYGFVDATGYRDDAVIAVAGMAGIPAAEARVIRYKRQVGILDLLLANASTPPQSMKLEIEGMPKFDSPRFMYLWTVGSAPAAHNESD